MPPLFAHRSVHWAKAPGFAFFVVVSLPGGISTGGSEWRKSFGSDCPSQRWGRQRRSMRPGLPPVMTPIGAPRAAVLTTHLLCGRRPFLHRQRHQHLRQQANTVALGSGHSGSSTRGMVTTDLSQRKEGTSDVYSLDRYRSCGGGYRHRHPDRWGRKPQLQDELGIRKALEEFLTSDGTSGPA
jgi:hypothetical protein